jgi:hypothetical protein
MEKKKKHYHWPKNIYFMKADLSRNAIVIGEDAIRLVKKSEKKKGKI